MTVERMLNVTVSAELAGKLALLERQYADAQHRLARGRLGDRTEVVRAEQLISQIENAAYEQLLNATPAVGSMTITVPWPFAQGPTPVANAVANASPPAEVWRSKRPRASRTDATYERFEAQLAEWADGSSPTDGRRALNPSEIQNRALTEALRKYATATATSPVNGVLAPVTYKDGSSAQPFPLRSVPISDIEPDDGREILRMTLLSVRHVDMDVDVDGAWLRNREISLPRAAALTDQMVSEQSREQFEIISERGPVTLHLYQTGLAPANVGFYRALVHHNRRPDVHPVAVVPFYYAGDNGYARSDAPWTIR